MDPKTTALLQQYVDSLKEDDIKAMTEFAVLMQSLGTKLIYWNHTITP
jgi:hypothetical protein